MTASDGQQPSAQCAPGPLGSCSSVPLVSYQFGFLSQAFDFRAVREQRW